MNLFQRYSRFVVKFTDISLFPFVSWLGGPATGKSFDIEIQRSLLFYQKALIESIFYSDSIFVTMKSLIHMILFHFTLFLLFNN